MKERKVRLYSMPLAEVQSLSKLFEENHEDTIQYINHLFESQKRSPYLIHNHVRLERAIFDNKLGETY